MSRLRQPWTIHDAEVALYPAWKDGMPFRGPGTGRGRPEAVLHCKASLGIEENWVRSAVTGHDWRGQAEGHEKGYEISISFPDGAVADDLARVRNRLEAGGFHILVVRFLAHGGEWTCLRFFYVVPVGDSEAESGQVMVRGLRLASGYLQETVGTSSAPSMLPQVLGEVEWVCGAKRVVAMTFDPDTGVWTSTAENDAGDGSRYVNLSPESADEGADVLLAYYVPRALTLDVPDVPFPRVGLEWLNAVALRIGGEESAGHHGCVLIGHEVQALGIVEPLLMIPQARMLDEPVVVFRYLRRVYAVLGHGILAVPKLVENEPPDFTHDPFFQLSPVGVEMSEDAAAGLVFLPDGAWLSGTLVPG